MSVPYNSKWKMAEETFLERSLNQDLWDKKMHRMEDDYPGRVGKVWEHGREDIGYR